MGANGLNGSDGETSDFITKTVAGLREMVVADKEQRTIAGVDFGGQVERLRTSLLPAAKDDDHTVIHVEEESMSQSDSNTTFAELRARLAEAHSDEKLAAAIGRSDTRHAEVVGRLDTGLAEIKGQIAAMNIKLEGIERTTGGIKTTVIVTGLAAVALIVAVVTYGQAWFGIGLSTRDAVNTEVAKVLQQTKPPVGTPP